jgi:hypothetical protein
MCTTVRPRQAGRATPISPIPGRLVLVNPHPSSAPYNTSRSPLAKGKAAQSAGPLSGAAARQRRTATPHRRPGRSLLRRWLAARARARPKARRSSPERTAPASAGSRSVRTGIARQPGLPGTPRRSRVRTGHTSDSSPATFRSAAGPRCPARCPVWIARHVTFAVPARPQCGHRAPPPGPELARAAPVVVVVPERTAEGRALPRDDGDHVMALFPA